MIRTQRLLLIPATAPTLQAAMDGHDALSRALQASVPPSWPPEFLDDQALGWVKARLEADPDEAAWWMYFMLLPGPHGSLTLIGTAGYKGPPNDEGIAEIGYGIVSDQRRNGYASEAARSLINRAFTDPRVRMVIAETLPELVASQGVLRVCGFTQAGEGSEPGVLRYQLPRPHLT